MQKYEELGQATKILRMAPAVEPGVRGRATVAAATTVVRSSFEEEARLAGAPAAVAEGRSVTETTRDPGSR
jgi:hypothetical protein